jgi:S1-C subfamily serine protease
MDKEDITLKSGARRGVPPSVLALSVVLTAAIVSGAFLIERRITTRFSKESHQSVTPGASQLTPTIPKPSAAPKGTVVGSSSGTINFPIPAPANLTDEELFTLKAPSVLLIVDFDNSGKATKFGSGFVAGPNGTVITNYHVIRGAYAEKVRFQDGTTADVLGVLGYSSTEDLAAIRLSSSSARPLELGDSDHVEVGDRVVAIGSPQGLQNTISDGLISGSRAGRIQTSAPISPGSSGGPFFNQQGQVIGVAVSTVTDAQNLNFVVPINLAKPYLADTTLTSLSDLTIQNTVVQTLMSSTVTVAAGQNYESPPIVIDENRMDDAELGGNFQSSGGVGGRIRVILKNQQTNAILYDSGRVTTGQFFSRLDPGVYRVVLDNGGSLALPRSVAINLALRFVK